MKRSGPGSSLLEVDGLTVDLPTPDGYVRVLSDVGFRIGSGETLGLVGESGSGKSMTVLSLVDLLPSADARRTGTVRFRGRDLGSLSTEQLRQLRGRDIAVVFQEPGASLHPALTIGEQIAEVVRAHEDVTRREARRRAVEMLSKVRIPDPTRAAGQYPFEFSGGMQQRAMLASALACGPSLLLADEPTTALDVTIQAQMLDLLLDLQDEFELGLLFVTHDLAVLRGLADRIAVMYAGEIVETASTADLFDSPQHPYTEALLKASGPLHGEDRRLFVIPDSPPLPGSRPTGCSFHPRCEYAIDACREDPPQLRHVRSSDVRCIRAEDLVLRMRMPRDDRGARDVGDRGGQGQPLFQAEGIRRVFQRRGLFGRRTGDPVVAVDGVDLTVHESETVGLVGESGSGKTTFSRIALRLLDPTTGRITFGGKDVTDLRGRDLRPFRGNVQAVFQDPTGSLDPTMTIGQHLAVSLRLHRGVSRTEARAHGAELLDLVGLQAHYLDRHPYELSGGQRQRACLARALAANPRMIVLDEPVSALDVSTQSRAVNVLTDVQGEVGVAYLVIAHDLPLVHQMSHRLAVMYLGRLVETGNADQVYHHPRHPYTQALVSVVPRVAPEPVVRERIVLAGEVPSPTAIPSGCRFRTRCPYAFEPCDEIPPEPITFPDGGTVECHLQDRGPRLAGASVDELLPPLSQASGIKPHSTASRKEQA